MKKQPVQTVVLADLKRDAVRIRRQAVLDRLDEILELYSSAHSFEQIVGMLQIAESPNYVRNVVMDSAYKQYTLAHRARAHTMVEKAVDVARQAISIGDSGGYRVATDVFLKVAAKLSPEDYGDKSRVEHTGKNGGAIKMIASALTDDQLAELIAKGGTMDAEEADE